LCAAESFQKTQNKKIYCTLWKLDPPPRLCMNS
jgi:hypothetical protein